MPTCASSACLGMDSIIIHDEDGSSLLFAGKPHSTISDKFPPPSKGDSFVVVLGGTGGVQIAKVFFQKLRSDLVVQTSG